MSDQLTDAMPPDSRVNRRCGECGRPLADAWLFGLCPRCQLGGGPEGAGEGIEPDLICRDFAERYEFLDDRPMARGGMGLVFRVRDRRLRRVVALKRVGESLLDSAAARSRFLAEAQIGSQLNHPGFLPIFDYGLDPEHRPFYTTVLLSGRTFHDVLAALRADPDPELARRRALEQLHRICEVVGYAHAHGVSHRDLKPSNILIGNYGEVFVIDLGSAAVSASGVEAPSVGPNGGRIETDRAAGKGDEVSSLTTAAVGLPHTPLFMPPEFLPDEGGCAAGPTADIYAVGVMLYELCAGRLPYADGDGSVPKPAELRRRILAGPPPPLRRLAHGVPRDLAAVCEMAMARDPANRYIRMADLAEDLRAFLETRVVQATRPGPVAKVAKWAARKSRQIAMASVVVAVLGVSLALAYSFKVQHDHARQVTRLREAQLASRNGQWRVALEHLEGAEQAGYTNVLDLALQRMEAWTALSRHDLIRAELERLEQYPNLGAYRGAVLLRRGENELFQQGKQQAGLSHVREALAAGLDRADGCVALGFLAKTSPEALTNFHRALEFNPYHTTAHRHSAGLEFILGQNERLDRHLAYLRLLYPEDRMPAFIEAVRAAADGRGAEAERVAEPLLQSMDPALRQKALFGLRAIGLGNVFFDIGGYVRGEFVTQVDTNSLLAEATKLLFSGGKMPSLTGDSEFGLPQLPCIREGLNRGLKGVMQLTFAMSLGRSPEPALAEVTAACRTHPEAFLPILAARVSENADPAEPAKLRSALLARARLLQVGIDCPSIFPKAHRFARFMLVLVQVQLGHRVPSPDPEARRACVEQLRWFLSGEPGLPVEYETCMNVAFELGEYDLARELWARWKSLSPDAPLLLKSEVAVELGARAYPRVLAILEGLPTGGPDTLWIQRAREKAVAEMRKLVEAAARDLPDPPSVKPPGP